MGIYIYIYYNFRALRALPSSSCGGLGVHSGPQWPFGPFWGPSAPSSLKQNYIFNQNSNFWGGLFYKTFLFEASLYMFLIFWNFRGSFLSSTFSFKSEFPLLVGSVLYHILI